jgi:hypothetical protein
VVAAGALTRPDRTFRIVHVPFTRTGGTLGSSVTTEGAVALSPHPEMETPMLRRLAIAAVLTAFTAPMLGGCIIIATDKPTTRVVHQSSDAPQ